MSHSRDELEKWLKTIDVKCDSVLDIGGSQLPIRGRTKSWEVKEYKIFDLEIPHECQQKPDIIGNLNELVDAKMTPYFNKFDTAFCIEVSEYFCDPVQAIKNISYFLKQGGILYISFHFIYPVHAPLDCDSLRYTRNGAVKLLEKAGFEVKDIVKRLPENMPNLVNVFKNEFGTKPSKKYNHHEEMGVLIKAIKK